VLPLLLLQLLLLLFLLLLEHLQQQNTTTRFTTANNSNGASDVSQRQQQMLCSDSACCGVVYACCQQGKITERLHWQVPNRACLPPYLSLLLCHDPVCLLHAPRQYSCSRAAAPLLQAAMQAIQPVELLCYLLSPGKMLLLLRIWLQLPFKGSWLLANCSSGLSSYW
jgi:hypothetical protein